MARRLLEAGWKLTVYDVNEAAVAPLFQRGAERAGSAAEVASRNESVVVSLPTPDIVRSVALGKDGIAAGGKVKTLVDLSTTGPRAAAEIAAELAKKSIAWIDAPVSGGVGGAEKGTLAVMVSGPRALCEGLRPMFDVIGKYFFIGEKPGMGQTMKLANNLVSATAMAISTEAIVMGVKAGLDPKVMCDVINAGSGLNTATRDKFPKSVLPRRFDYGFATALMYKDVKLCLEEAEALGTPMFVAAAVRQLWANVNAKRGGDSDFTEIVKLIEGWAGVEVKG
jgi:3-hydroxyisobutyrate dehydrogenase-like beta-hydroxyacid dehydrogenase